MGETPKPPAQPVTMGETPKPPAQPAVPEPSIERSVRQVHGAAAATGAPELPLRPRVLDEFVVLGSYLWFAFLSGCSARPGRTNVGGVHLRNARRVERTIVELQGLFIKVGQLLSIMANFLPSEFRVGARGVPGSGAAPPLPRDRGAASGRSWASRWRLFDRFVEDALASASLGQVHEAWLKDGAHVAVKVQHQDIDEIVRLDLKTIRRILAIVTLFVPVKGMEPTTTRSRR